MPAMNVSITPELMDIVQKKVASGLYSNASEVVREAIRTMEVNEKLLYELKLARLKQILAPSIAQADAGECVPFCLDDLIAELDAEAHA